MEKQYKLTAEAVDAVLKASLYANLPAGTVEPPPGAIVVPSIAVTYAFDPERIEQQRETVLGWMDEIPVEYFPSSAVPGGGDGFTFLGLCYRRDKSQWTGFQQTMDALCAIAIGLKLAAYLLPREYWSVLPGSVPYVMFDTKPVSHDPEAFVRERQNERTAAA